jgi:hypothetical protein
MLMELGVGYRSGREAKIEIPAGWMCSKKDGKLQAVRSVTNVQQ